MQVQSLSPAKNRTGIATGIIFLAVGFIFGYAVAGISGAGGENISGGGSGAVSLMIDTGVSDIMVYRDIALLADEDLFSLTRRIAQENEIPFAYKDYAELGVFVSQIGDAPGASADAFWQYWVNNRYGQTGADKYQVAAGDVIVWKLTKQQEKN